MIRDQISFLFSTEQIHQFYLNLTRTRPIPIQNPKEIPHYTMPLRSQTTVTRTQLWPRGSNHARPRSGIKAPAGRRERLGPVLTRWRRTWWTARRRSRRWRRRGGNCGIRRGRRIPVPPAAALWRRRRHQHRPPWRGTGPWRRPLGSLPPWTVLAGAAWRGRSYSQWLLAPSCFWPCSLLWNFLAGREYCRLEERTEEGSNGKLLGEYANRQGAVVASFSYWHCSEFLLD